MKDAPAKHGTRARGSIALLRSLAREPLLHFVLAGFALFIGGEVIRSRNEVHHIVVTQQREAHLASRYQLQFGARPDAPTLARLVERDVEEEMLFRQGLALGLDRDDEIVRRRIVQKMRFLLEDLSAPREPSDAELNAYYQAHAEKYAAPTRITFSHLYFSRDAGDHDARERAAQALGLLSSGKAQVSDLGDPFPDRYHFSGYEAEQVYRLFGRTEFSSATLSAPLDRWLGPYQSVYGWHLVRVDARTEAQHLELVTVRDRVRTDYLLDAQARTNAAALETLAGEFTVVRERS
ncbi:MAG TPA: peptidyl-prolyl cis-trans isomerase [Steroidobacter sp.]|uniref:peptidyl-prolyl cis-trans isomerase n=1 Tax=Steroidobacter sp. TaxID=1978227 RepID=UPI002EDB628B